MATNTRIPLHIKYVLYSIPMGSNVGRGTSIRLFHGTDLVKLSLCFPCIHKAVLWIQIHCIWILILNFGPIGKYWEILNIVFKDKNENF